MWEVRRHWGPLAVPGPHLRSGRAAGPGGAALYSPHLRFDVPAVAAQTLPFARRRDEEVTERRLGGEPPLPEPRRASSPSSGGMGCAG